MKQFWPILPNFNFPLNYIEIFAFVFFVAVTQEYRTDPQIVYVIVGNSALLKCEIPSFVADFVTIDSWIDNNGKEYFSGINLGYGNTF